LDHKKQARLRWLQKPSEIRGDNLSDARLEDGRHFRKKKREYLKTKINEIARINKSKSIRDP
jgi:uncharacterized protein YaaR (DUF327 family)